MNLHTRLLLVIGLSYATFHFDVGADEQAQHRLAEKIHTLGGLEQGYTDSTFFIANLKLALSLTVNDFGDFELIHETLPMHPLREFKSLASGNLDVIWSMTSIYRETIAIPVRVPLTYGLFGCRLIVANSDGQLFAGQNFNLSHLKNKLAAQGPGWPDTDILRHNGFNVYTTSVSADIYQLLERGSFDYFPRSILEIDQELISQNRNFYIESKNVLYYPTAMYLFVSPENPKLARRLTVGLQRATENGSRRALFDKYLLQKPSAKNLVTKTVHVLNNPFLTEETRSVLASNKLAIQIDNKLH